MMVRIMNFTQTLDKCVKQFLSNTLCFFCIYFRVQATVLVNKTCVLSYSRGHFRIQIHCSNNVTEQL